MSSRHGSAASADLPLVLVLLVVLSTLGCRARRGPEDEHAQPPAPVAAAASVAGAPVVVPVDRALPGELAEGTERAFGLAVPRVMTIRGRFDDVVFAAGEVPPDQVANYVRQRVTAEKVETGAAKTLFSRATVRAQPGPLVFIEVIGHGTTTELHVRDVTPKPTKPGQTPEERWRELGFNPDGTPLDPTRLQ